MDGTETTTAAATAGTPLFADPKARALSRVGVVDIGSNSVRLVVFDGAARSPAYFFNEKVLCGLGSGLSETGRLNPEGRARALGALKRFAVLGQRMNLPSMLVVATAAMRDAEDGPEFKAQIEAETGLTVQVIDGAEEARLSAQGVLLGWPGSYGLVCDIGGSSMELAEIQKGCVGKRATSDLGPLKLRDVPGGRDGRAAFIKTALDRLSDTMGQQRDRLFLVGGSWRAIARIDMHRRKYPLHVQHEYRLTASDVHETIAYLAKQDLESLRKACGISEQRMALVPVASEVLGPLIERFQPVDIAVSAYGIREGLLYEQMPDSIRSRDPLIEACRFAEAKDSRNPGFGQRLYNFVLPLFAGAPRERLRMVHAACLLHDVSWRAHPDYRSEVCFDYATRSALGGLTHQERVWLGLALLHRYKNKRDGSRFEAQFELLGKADKDNAAMLGRAMRFGAMLWLQSSDGDFPRLIWSAETKRLVLHLDRDQKALFGEVAETRFRALANALDAEDVVVKIND